MAELFVFALFRAQPLLMLILAAPADVGDHHGVREQYEDGGDFTRPDHVFEELLKGAYILRTERVLMQAFQNLGCCDFLKLTYLLVYPHI